MLFANFDECVNVELHDLGISDILAKEYVCHISYNRNISRRNINDEAEETQSREICY